MPLPPSSPVHPLLQTLRWTRDPYGFLEECARRHGDIFQLRLAGFGDLVVTSRPEGIKEIFAAPSEVLSGGRSNEILRPFVGANSVLVLDGPEHLRQRKLLMPAFHGERMQALGQTMLDLANASIDRWPVGARFPLHRPLQEVTLRVILRTIFGMDEGPGLDELFEVTRRGSDVASNPLLLFSWMQRDWGPLSPWGRFLRYSNRADEILREEVERRRAGRQREDILGMLLEARDDEGQPLTFAELRDELVTMLVAGHETTATALSWTLAWLLRDGALCQRLRAELEGAAEGGRLLPERVAKLALLEAAVREGLRLRPIAPMVGRMVTRPFALCGYEIPPGCVVAAAVSLAHQRPEVFPDWERFDPARFLRGRPTANEWLPFGGGSRRCLGAAFATHEMKMVLAAVLWRTRLEVAPGYTPRAKRRGVTMTPADGVVVRMPQRPLPAA